MHPSRWDEGLPREVRVPSKGVLCWCFSARRRWIGVMELLPWPLDPWKQVWLPWCVAGVDGSWMAVWMAFMVFRWARFLPKNLEQSLRQRIRKFELQKSRTGCHHHSSFKCDCLGSGQTCLCCLDVLRWPWLCSSQCVQTQDDTKAACATQLASRLGE